MKERILVAMSGGVDSSVAAALVENGYDVVGMTMQLWDYGSRESTMGIDAAPQKISKMPGVWPIIWASHFMPLISRRNFLIKSFVHLWMITFPVERQSLVSIATVD